MAAETVRAPERIGLIGLGQMGTPMGRNLARAGFRLAVADASADAVRRFAAETSCEVPPDLKSLGAACRVVITMLPDGATVRRVVLGETGRDGADCLAAGLAQGAVVIDMSSSSPVGTRELGPLLAARGIALVDAPVSGGVKKAIDGSLAIMAGGDPAVIEAVRPVLGAMGGKVFATGPLGAGHAMKALNNYVSAAGFAAAAEAVLAGARFGLAPETIVTILNASTGRNNSTENKFPQMVLPRSFNSGFTVGLMVKDLRIALDVAKASGMPAPLAEACLAEWAAAERELGAAADHTAAVKHWERLAGSEIPVKKGS
jgi:3-hydroxyisobutyrate dehydrogenase